MEHRWGERVQVDFPIRVTAHPFAVRDGRLTDLSVSGASIESEFELRLLSRVEVSIILPMWPKHEAPTIAAYVSRKFKKGIGVEWCEFAPDAVSRLLRVVITRPHAYVRRPAATASLTISRLSAPLLRHGSS